MFNISNQFVFEMVWYLINMYMKKKKFTNNKLVQVTRDLNRLGQVVCVYEEKKISLTIN